MISKTIRNECAIFGGHIGIEVSYKILQLKILASICSIYLAFNRGCFEAVLIGNTQRTLGV
jgi:hypothetical protein